MGMYTECHVDLLLRQDTPHDVIKMLRLLASTDDADMAKMDDFAQTLSAQLFTLERWRGCLMLDSAYFETDAHRSITQMPDGRTRVHATWNQKNYDGEIEAFWAWLAPWVDCGANDVLGHTHYEEDDEPVAVTGADLAQWLLDSASAP